MGKGKKRDGQPTVSEEKVEIAEPENPLADPIAEEATGQDGVDHLKGLKARYLELCPQYGGDIAMAMFRLCFENDIVFDEELLEVKFLRHSDDEVLAKLPEAYVWELESDPGKYGGKTFFSQLRMENFSKVYAEGVFLGELAEDDKKNRMQVISILGYDPFKNDPNDERPQLYRDLAGMLSEAMRKDVPKQKAAVEVVRNYANINRYQKKVTEIMKLAEIDDKTQKELDSLLQVISKIQTNVNQTTKENGFTGGKSLGSSGRGMLSDVMIQCEEQGYDPGVTNFYDVLTSKSIGEVADISWRSMLNQVLLSDTDYADVLADQANLVRTAQKIAAEARESARLAKEKLTKQELLKELELEYRRKGISEEEIDEFISREFTLKEGKNA